MHQRILMVFRRLAEKYEIKGPCLEVGASRPDKAIIGGEYFKDLKRHALNLKDLSKDYAAASGITFHRGNSNDMRSLFPDGMFNTVISNAVLEHDRYFWLSVAEMKRILAPGGILLLGVPGFLRVAKTKVESDDAEAEEAEAESKNPVARTVGIHSPPDYWRFSPQAFKRVLLEGLELRSLNTYLDPPRIIAVAQKPA